jgi:hypothetical protein
MKQCNEMEFEVGDWIFLRIEPYKEMSLKQKKKDNKLKPKYHGPYKVLQRVGSMDHKLEFHPYSHVNPVFHIYFLKKVIDNKILIQTILLEINKQGKIILEPKKSLKQGLRSYKIEQLLSTSSSGRSYQ